MKPLLSLVFLFFWITLNSQNQSDDYFTFYKEGEKYLKPIKYIVFENGKDQKTENKSTIYFYIEGNRFKYSKKEHKVDLVTISYLDTIEKSEVSNLPSEEFKFYKKMIDKDGYWRGLFETRPPIPTTKNHLYFRVFILEKKKGKVLRYRVNWEYFQPLQRE